MDSHREPWHVAHMSLGIAMQRAARRGDCSDGVLETGDATRSQDHSECEVHWPLLRGAYKGVCSVAHENARSRCGA